MPGPMKDPRNTQGRLCRYCRLNGGTGIGCPWLLQSGKEETGAIGERDEHDRFLATVAEQEDPLAHLKEFNPTPEQLAQFEERAGQDLREWFEAFFEFPNDDNRLGVIQQMRVFQTAWMHGRKRL